MMLIFYIKEWRADFVARVIHLERLGRHNDICVRRKVVDQQLLLFYRVRCLGKV